MLRQLYVASDGNPLFGKEVAALLAERGLADDPTAPLPVQVSASDAIGRRVASLARSTRDVLLGAAALPRPTVDVLLAAYEEQHLEAALVESAAAGIVTVDGERIRFTHPLVATAVYQSATPARRRAAHAALARVLPRPEERAPHLALAATRPSGTVAAELDSAATAARARGALDTAGRLFEQAATVTPARESVARRRRGLEASRCHFAAGDTDRARRLLDPLVELSRPGEESAERAGQELAFAPVLDPWLAWGDHALGLVALERGEPAAALEHFEQAEHRNDAVGFRDPAFRPTPAGIEALIALGRLDTAAARVAEYEQRCSPDRHAPVLAVVARYRGLIASLRGEHDDAEAAFKLSLDLQELSPSPYERGRTLIALAAARRRRRRRGAARAALEEAVTLFEQSGAVVWADRARADIATLGLRRGPAGALTPMESRVARAVAGGATNRDAASSLFLSERTIEFHLRNVYRKLEVSSRRELAVVLAPVDTTTPSAV